MTADGELNLKHTFTSAEAILDLRDALQRAADASGDDGAIPMALIERIAGLVRLTPDAHVPPEWHVLLAGLRVLASHATCLKIAKGSHGDVVAERLKFDVLRSDLRNAILPEHFDVPATLESRRNELVAAHDLSPQHLCDFLLSLPLPPLYRRQHDDRRRYHRSTESTPSAPTPLLRLILFLDDAPIATPQLLRKDLLYPLVIRLRGLSWPDAAERLHLTLLTTCPQSEYAISPFILERPEINDHEYHGELTGKVLLRSAQSSILGEIVFAIRAAFELPNGKYQEVPVIGHHELRVRVVSEQQHPLMTGNRRLDGRIEELTMTLLKDYPRINDELPELWDMLQALTRLLATYAQEAAFKGRTNVKESEFQKAVLHDLRIRLGQDVQEHPDQAGGTTDIRYRGVIVELKVERKNGDRQHICTKYTPQSAQYAGVEARQVSVVLVLDLTEKERPPGDIRNDILLRNVSTHGGDDVAKHFPSKAFVFIVNGNMRDPSSYSR